MQAVLCVAGRGTRVRAMTSLPKCLLTIQDVPILERTIRALALGPFSIREIAVVVSHSGLNVISGELRRIRDQLHQKTGGTIETRLVMQPLSDGSLDAVLHGLEVVDTDEPIMVVWGDGLYDLDGIRIPVKTNLLGVARAPEPCPGNAGIVEWEGTSGIVRRVRYAQATDGEMISSGLFICQSAGLLRQDIRRAREGCAIKEPNFDVVSETMHLERRPFHTVSVPLADCGNVAGVMRARGFTAEQMRSFIYPRQVT